MHDRRKRPEHSEPRGGLQTPLRTAPRQARAKATVSHLLTHATAILDRGGADALTTSALATRAAVRIRTVYRYFPNRRAILSAIATRLAAEQEDVLGDFSVLADLRLPWPVAVDRMVATFVACARVQPGQRALRGAMRSSRELQAVDARLDARLADRLASALIRRGAAIALPRARHVAATFIAAATATLDAVVLDRDDARPPLSLSAARREITRLAETYLGSYLRQPRPDTAAASDDPPSNATRVRNTHATRRR